MWTSGHRGHRSSCQSWGKSQNWDMAYVVRDQKESILEALGIDVLNPRGRVVVKAVTMMT